MLALESRVRRRRAMAWNRTVGRVAAPAAPARAAQSVAASVVLAAGMVLWSAVAAAEAAPRVALVVGNGGYDPENIRRLDNPVNDARLMARTLEKVGFEVSLVTDADREAMEEAVEAFGKRLGDAGRDAVGLFYFAGHGVEARGVNYLIPLGARIGSEMEFRRKAVPAPYVLDWMQDAGNRLNMLILDACRDNPYGGTRGGARGLAPMTGGPSGSLIAYSAGPGKVATDGDGENSPYTLALAQTLLEPGLPVEEVFKRVRIRVEADTRGDQTPWENTSLKGDFYFAPPRESDGGPGPAADGVGDDGRGRVEGAGGLVKAQRMETERRFWASIEGSRNPAKYRAYLRKYGEDGEFVDLARIELEELEGGGRAAAETGEAASPAPEAVESSLGLERSERRLVQHALASLGHAPGTADGWFGDRTRRAIRRYQAAARAEATGYLTVEQAKALVARGEEVARAQAKAEAERREHERQATAPGRRFRDCEGRWCPEMVVVPAGSLSRWGSPQSENRDGAPTRVRVHRVTHCESVFGGCARGHVRASGTHAAAAEGCTHNPDDQGWGRGTTAGGGRELARCAAVRRVAVAQDGRSGTGC